ncbi:calcium-responsive transactivator-like [Antennarius striatus]|uniref:calcium-responsive transactivator-like n=1 Tax=Antennarius striatus TaxID=241820 RepID=UPI0035B40C88
MSVAFSSARPRSKGEVTQQAIQKMLDENHHLIQCIMDYQSKGKTAECTQYQQILHRNLVYLATIADSNQNMQSLLPAPPTANLSMGPGAMGQSGAHVPSNLNDITPGLPPTSVMQSHMTNVSVMHQQSTAPHYSPAQAGGQHYQGQQAMGLMSQASQGSGMTSQRPMGSYRSSQQGSAQQYVGQDEFYGEQYGHNQSSSEPINQQYYPEGHGEYSYQQPSYGEPGYDRSFEESSHYYEGGTSQYGQQQAPFQQQYAAQSYSGQTAGYGPGQGASSQYTQYQQGQSQQYGSYRSTQGGPGAQTQRPYSYEQGQYGNYQQ